MSLQVADRVQVQSSTYTTSSFTLGSAVTGFQSFSALTNGNTTYYAATDSSGNWEVGYGAYTSATPALARTTILASSNSGSVVTFSGTVNVFITYPAEKVVIQDANGIVAWTNQAPGYTNTVTAAGTTTITASATYYQHFSGTTTQTLKLPDETTIPIATGYIVDNDSSGNVTVQDSAGNTLATAIPGGAGWIYSLSNGSATGNWAGYLLPPGNSATAPLTWGTAGLNMAGQYLQGVTTLNMTGQLTNTVATGTAPFVVSSTTQVANLNAATAGSVTNALTLNNSGSGAASGTTYNGSSAVTLSYNTLGASPVAGSSSIVTVGTVTTGTWNATAVGVGYGGTGLTSTPTNGQIDIGNGSGFTRTTLTAGTGISVSNASGSITITNTSPSSGGTVTSVSGTGSVNGITLTGTVTASGSLTLGGTLGSIANSQLTNSSVTVTAGTGLSGGGAVSLGSSVTLSNAGVTSNAAGTGISVSASTGAVTITNSGVTSLSAGTGISVSGSTGGVTVTNSGVTSAVAGTGVSVSGATGAVTFSIPQAITTTSSVQFGSFGVGTAASGTTGEIRATNNVTAYYSSDIKFKENIHDVPDALQIVCAIGSKIFDWKDEYLTSHGGEDGYFIRKSDFGVIAQDVEKVFSRAVRTRPDGSLAVDYEKLSTLAFGAIAQLLKRIEALENK